MAPPGERPLASARPFLVLVGIAVAGLLILFLTMLRDPGMPAHVNEDYMRVAGRLLTAEIPLRDAEALSAALRERFQHPVQVPDLSAQQFTLDGGATTVLGDTPAVVAMYHHGRLKDLLVWHAYEGQVADLPPTPDVRDRDGRSYYIHRKTTNTLVFWQEGPLVHVITCGLPTEQVFGIAAASRRPDEE